MGKMLTAAQAADFERDGYLFPLRAFSAAEARGYRHALESYEAETGDAIHSNMRHKVHLLFRWADEVVHHPPILDAVEDILGPDLLCWTTNFFIKEANDPAFVSWHQDSTYWGLEPADVVTAWVAFTDAPVESGAMRFLPGSHKLDQISHRDTYAADNLLTRGQEIEMDGRRGAGRRRAAQGRRILAAPYPAGPRLGTEHDGPTGGSASRCATSRPTSAR